ncbi:MAG: hypothetical protein KatS3mg055_3710 [Chloroflexus sp.]|nr:MAG: hypothetical protein KatS3mg055_3710 [Chloroflexus sp.]
MHIEEVVAFVACALRGGTAPPCPYGWRSVRYRPLRLCVLCAFALTALR